MPEISRFFGIVIAMYFRDHNPPHFHAYYGDYTIEVEIESGRAFGEFPKRALGLVLEWLEINRTALMENWTRADGRQSIRKIPPLE